MTVRTKQETFQESMKNRFMDFGYETQRVLRSVGHTSFVQNLVKLLLRLLWSLLHLAVNVWYFVLDIAHMLQSFLISNGLLRNYKVLNLSRLRYLAIVVDSEEAQHTSWVVELLNWLSAIGVKHVCLYDMKGVLKESKEIILKKLGVAMPWEVADERNLFLERKHMVLEFVSFSDGKEGVAKAASFLCSKYLKGASRGEDQEPVFTEPEMTSALRAVGCGGPEPDLLLIYGPGRCHLGFPAWRLRYTEIVHMGSLKSMNYGAMIRSIRKFTMVHQNYGS
ncbi:dehydrodolichyl diphosphate synthase complex subunit NUS1-like isoform X2 [Macadamia integrifolia]|uniref:dehydrodolichyl diphosphate synthase complex subunit NUS1-like isoform X2 n=1 Tax=Macadamia integrifolia TaxID=60698 RepID=UPI001C4FB78B|nr:dehydrodolichyl diphosphate synthase complex subunit NUS1-like isoform X2 [Macadamia integrifolia]XP_042508497.1 dehydrodolichyl diphosphate synthase complex subunit NUS1-like isoform X2 [Macadamia integrifolia]XP_042508498.1 dehydrodolichyl diphosphate synthase complex subunit NUS1-like isoform X2 [Macadamia integrifolia]